MVREPMAKSRTKHLATIAPFTVDADKKARLERIAEAHHRSLTAHLRFLIDRAIDEDEQEAA